MRSFATLVAGLAAPVLVIPLVILADAAGVADLVGRVWQEPIAPFLPGAAGAAFLVRWWRGRHRMDLLLAILALAFMCREIHFPGTHQGVYVAVAGLTVWAAAWGRSLWAELKADPVRARWLAMTVWAYAVTILVQRRALRFLPGEDRLHIPMEELGENVAHVFLLVLAVIAAAREVQSSKSKVQG